MSKSSRAFRLFLPTVAALLYAGTAHAGMLGFMDEAFTFRKEQKPLVEPRRTIVPPKRIVQPYYPNDQHVTWSNFYTRTDLEPQNYLSNSASKVMRPAQEDASNAPAQAQGGWPAIAERAAQNAQLEAEAETNVMIGEPGQSPMMASSDANIGRATRIGPAVEDWRNQNDGSIPSRPGDFDYRAPVGAVAQNAAPTTEVGGSIDFATTSNDPRYVDHNTKGQVTKYAVQGGDTLSSISDQPAIYGTWKLWPLIYSANRRAIGGSPNNLRKDQRLDIPRDYTEQQARDAEAKGARYR